MTKIKKEAKRRSILYPLSALGSWLALLTVILTVEPGPVSSYLLFLGLFTLGVASSTMTVFLLINRRFGKKLNPHTARRRAWLLAVGLSLVAVLQLFRLTSAFHLILITAILTLSDIYFAS